MSGDLRTGIVRVLRDDGSTAGTGFLASYDGLIVTCSHVVQHESLQHAGNPLPDRATIVFQTTGVQRETRVESAWWRPFDAGDVAILRLVGDVPQGSSPLLLGSAHGTTGHAIRTFGYPDANPDEGLFGDGHIVGDTTIQGQSLLQLSSMQVTPGFSGGPVVDLVSGRVVGMVSSITPPDRYARQATTAFATPTEVLRILCPALQVSDRAPYLGLDAFREEDASLFFGRERVAEHLVNSLRRDDRFLAVLGPSGCGKSSVVRAGLLPRLRAGRVPGSDHWGVLVTRPDDRAHHELNASESPSDRSSLKSAARGWLATHPECERLAVVVDQFEEALAGQRGQTSDRQRAFIADVVALLQDSRFTIILTMRDEFYSRLVQEAPALATWLETGLVNLRPYALHADELRAIVDGPAHAVGLRFEPGLAETIVADTLKAASPAGADNADARNTVLPLLEFALLQLWERRRDGLLTRAAYESLGGVTGGLRRWADRAFDALDAELRPLALRVLTSLVHLGDESLGIPDSRRRRLVADLSQDEAERSAIQEVVRRLAGARILVTDRQRGQATVEIIHESLLREWGTLRRRLQEDQHFLTWRQRIESQTLAWIETGPSDPSERENGRLLRGRDLVAAQDWLTERPTDIGDQVHEYIAASRVQETREVEQLRHALAEAERQRQVAFSREVAASAMAQLPTDPEFGLLLAVEAVRIAPTRQAEVALRQALSSSRVRATLRGHTWFVRSAEFSPDGTLVLTGSADSTARLWDVSSGSTVRLLHGHSDQVYDASFSRDGVFVVTASLDKTARVWDVATGGLVSVLEHPTALHSAVPSLDRQFVITATGDGMVRCWELRTGRSLYEFKAHESLVTSVRLSPNGDLAVTASWDHSARVWDTKTWRKVVELVGHTGYVDVAQFDPSGELVATAGVDGTVVVWEARTGRRVHVLHGHAGPVSSAAFSPDGRFLVTASSDGSALVREITGKVVAELRGHEDRVGGAAFSPDGRLVVTAGTDGTARLWDSGIGGGATSLRGLARSVHHAAFSPDKGLVATVTEIGTVDLWKTGDGENVGTLGSTDPHGAVNFSPNGTSITIAGKVARAWDIASGMIVAETRGPARTVWAAALSTDGKLVATGDSVPYDAMGSPASAWVWEASTGTVIAELRRHRNCVISVAFSSDASMVATTGTLDPSTCVWRTKTGMQMATLVGHERQVDGAAFSPDGELVVTWSQDLTARVWHLGTQRTLAELRGHAGLVHSATFSRNSKLVVTTGADGTARLWDARSGAPMGVVRRHAAAIDRAVFSADGRLLLTASQDGIVRIEHCDVCGSVDELVELARTRVTRQLSLAERELYLHVSE